MTGKILLLFLYREEKATKVNAKLQGFFLFNTVLIERV